MEPVSVAIGLLGLGVKVAEAAGWLKKRTDPAVKRLDAKVAALVEAPWAEGLSRLEQAAVTKDEHRRRQLLDEARSKFTDVQARAAAGPVVRASASLALAATWSQLGDQQLAQRSWTQAGKHLVALDRAVAKEAETERQRAASNQAVAAAGAASGVAAAGVLLSGGLLLPIAAAWGAHRVVRSSRRPVASGVAKRPKHADLRDLWSAMGVELEKLAEKG